jgi:acyl dehydratase
VSEPVKLSEIPELAGSSFDGDPFVVSNEERELFEHVTWVDRAYPEPDAPEFPRDLVEGFHTLALLDAVATLVRPFDPRTTYGYNYGLDKVRFVSPIRIGDRVNSHFEVLRVQPKASGWLVLRRCTLTVEAATRPAMVADWWVLVLPRSDSGTAAGGLGE